MDPVQGFLYVPGQKAITLSLAYSAIKGLYTSGLNQCQAVILQYQQYLSLSHIALKIGVDLAGFKRQFDKQLQAFPPKRQNKPIKITIVSPKIQKQYIEYAREFAYQKHVISFEGFTSVAVTKEEINTGIDWTPQHCDHYEVKGNESAAKQLLVINLTNEISFIHFDCGFQKSLEIARSKRNLEKNIIKLHND